MIPRRFVVALGVLAGGLVAIAIGVIAASVSFAQRAAAAQPDFSQPFTEEDFAEFAALNIASYALVGLPAWLFLAAAVAGTGAVALAVLGSRAAASADRW